MTIKTQVFSLFVSAALLTLASNAAACGGEGEKKDESVRLCGGEGEKKDESVRLCGGEGEKKDESVRL